MQCVARGYDTLGIKDVAGGTHSLYRVHPDAVALDKTEGKGRIKKCHIDATLVGRIGHDVFITGVAKQAALGEVVDDAVIFHLAEGDKDALLPGLGIGVAIRLFANLRLATRNNRLPHPIQLLPIAGETVRKLTN